MRRKSFRETLQRRVPNRLSTVKGYFPARQVKRLSLRFGNFVYAKVIGKIGAAAYARTKAADCLQPSDGTLQECRRRHKDAFAPQPERMQHVSNQPHVMV